MEYDNPANRLLSILIKGKAIPGPTQCREAWQQLLGEVDNDVQLASRLGKVMELAELSAQSIRDEFPQQSQACAHWESTVNYAFMAQSLNASWDTFISHIDNHAVNYLQLVSELLQTKLGAKVISDEELRLVREQVDCICAEVIGSNIEIQVKQYLIRTLRKILTAIDEYRISGAYPVMDTIDAVFGHAAKHEGYRNFLTNTELGNRVLDTLSAAANVVTVAVGLPQISVGIALLPALT
jgi:hypothetical protein